MIQYVPYRPAIKIQTYRPPADRDLLLPTTILMNWEHAEYIAVQSHGFIVNLDSIFWLEVLLQPDLDTNLSVHIFTYEQALWQKVCSKQLQQTLNSLLQYYYV